MALMPGMFSYILNMYFRGAIMKRSFLGLMVVFSLFAPGLFARVSEKEKALAVRQNLAAHKIIHNITGVVTEIGKHRIRVEEIMRVDKEEIEIKFGRMPVGVVVGQRVRASYELKGTTRIGISVITAKQSETGTGGS
jgi:hypothetical protein